MFSNKIFLALILIFCFSRAHAETAPFKVGLIFPLSGTAVEYGEAMKNSIILATQDHPELFTNIKFIYEDAAYEPRQAVTSLNKLTTVDKVDLVVTWGVGFCQALAPIVQARKIPLIGICVDSGAAQNSEYVLRYMNVSDEFMRVILKYLGKLYKNKMGILLADNSYLEESYEALTRNLISGQTLEIIDRLPMNAMDFRSHIINLKKSDYDAIVVFLYRGQISTFYRQAKDLGLNKLTFGTNIFETSEEIQASHGAMNGALFPGLEIKPDFIKRYEKTFGNQSQLGFGAPAFELAICIGKLFNSANSKKIPAREILDAFKNLHNIAGTASGPYSYVDDPKFGRYFRFPIVIKKITREGFEVLK